MVQLKYFGDSRDYFKYDLITHILRNCESLHNFTFVPMLTKHRVDREGNKQARKDINNSDKSAELLAFIGQCSNKSLGHWENWLRPFCNQYLTVEPVDATFFADHTRADYWEKYRGLIASPNALVFLDPDTGLETGKPWYLAKNGREKYILNPELCAIMKWLNYSSVIMLYQHLQRNKWKHEQDVQNKMAQVRRACGEICVSSYREDELAFLFVSRNGLLHSSIEEALLEYHRNSTHRYKSLHSCCQTKAEDEIFFRSN